MKKKLLLFSAVLLIIAAAATAAFVLFRNRPGQPVELLPAGEHAIGEAEFYMQNDERWADDELGGSGYRMRGSGCLVSCIASALHAQGLDINPGELNRLFSENEVYNERGEVIWGNISKVYPQVRTEIPSQIKKEEIERALDNGSYPIVKVRYKGTGYQHWVLLIGSTRDDFLCMDPLNTAMEPLTLSEHGGTVYACRFITVMK